MKARAKIFYGRYIDDGLQLLLAPDRVPDADLDKYLTNAVHSVTNAYHKSVVVQKKDTKLSRSLTFLDLLVKEDHQCHLMDR